MSRKYFGIDLGGTTISFIYLSSPKDVIAEKTIETPSDGDGIVDAMVKTIDEMIQGGERPAGIGIAMAGEINEKKNSVIFSPNLPFKEEFAIGEKIEKRLGLSVKLENDANAAAVGEKVFGSAKEMDDFIVLTLGTGIGSGIYTGGKLLKGCTSSGGEAGHMVIDVKGNLCGCGRRGCLESFASGTAIAKWVERESGVLMSAKNISDSAKDGDETSINAFKEAGDMLGSGLASLINIFNPEAIFFTGSLVDAPSIYLDTAIKKAKREAFGSMGGSVRLEVSSISKNAGLLGSAGLF